MDWKIMTVVFFLLSVCWISAQDPEARISTRIDTMEDNRLMMVQEFTVNASIDETWKAYTTKTGWEGWVAPLVEVDWKINGTIRSNYDPNGMIGDSSTIVTHIINYIPHRMITFQAEITEHFPAFMKEDECELFNIITFESLAPNNVRITSHGLGYRNIDEYQKLMQYFIQANEQTQLKLIAYLENQ